MTLVIGPEPREGVPVEEVKRELYTRLDRPARHRGPPDHRPAPGPSAAGPPGAGARVRLGAVRTRTARPTRCDSTGDDGFRADPGQRTGHRGRRPGDRNLLPRRVPGYGRLVDGGDHGDTYNYSPPDQRHDRRHPDLGDRHRRRARARSGPPSTSSATYDWPESRRRRHPRPGRVAKQVVVTTTLELRADEPTVRVRTRFTNPSRDHRLRVHLPLPTPATTSEAECAFTVVERGLTAEGRAEEFGLPTFPSRRFVRAGGLTVVHEGLLEYELVDIAATPGPVGPAGHRPWR